ncbi:KTSC domain-containing protein [Ascidiimonas sp. W6]|uniref:KTSC domain-containing protein n=1 Tax=Ascidiimonas meishanensis TaxID=3128903 RepID=UPI0030EB73A9
MQSRKIIDGYHFLVRVASETMEKNYQHTATMLNASIVDHQHKGLLLEISFTNGTIYEFFGGTKRVYLKIINAGSMNRLAKRTIYQKYSFRKSKRIFQEVN